MVKMVSMKRSETDKRQDMGCCPSPECVAPDYPYGLVINLDTDELDKLGVKDLPALNAEFTITAKVCVTRRSESAAQTEYREAEGDQRSITLQITDIGLA